ncbi:MAG TPA: hypothetical protein VJ743_01895 [Albitalea sp.]|nr:hypothetical protein [Albitalea sp.]
MSEHRDTATTGSHGIEHSSSAPPVAIPPSHVGEFVIPGTGRLVWWTGRVAIGLLYEPTRRCDPPGESSLWIQELMLRRRRGADRLRASVA